MSAVLLSMPLVKVVIESSVSELLETSIICICSARFQDFTDLSIEHFLYNAMNDMLYRITFSVVESMRLQETDIMNTY